MYTKPYLNNDTKNIMIDITIWEDDYLKIGQSEINEF